MRGMHQSRPNRTFRSSIIQRVKVRMGRVALRWKFEIGTELCHAKELVHAAR